MPLKLPSRKISSTILLRSFAISSRWAVTPQSPSAVISRCKSFPRGRLIGRGGQSSESFAVLFVGGCGAVRLVDGRVRLVKSLGKELESWGNDDLLDANIRAGGVSDSAMVQEKNEVSTDSKRINRDILVPGDEVKHLGDPLWKAVEM